MPGLLEFAIKPKPALEEFDTGLRYTDILFGFVLRELFIRLQHWTQIEWDVRLHLIVGTILVLGSWIGYRNSVYRSSYQLKFFNIPLFRFIIDQIMLITYFRMASLTSAPQDFINTPQKYEGNLLSDTALLVVIVFFLYVF
jgi:hypothetical protein